MENTRLEILKDGVYVSLKLRDNQPIRYNNVINKIGKVDSREISHSNTFSIPYIFHNINALELNSFNVHDLAVSLNQKYEAKYYKDDTLLRKGFVVVNSTDAGFIRLNFIDSALSLTQKWGSTTYRELLRNPSLPIPSNYKTAITEMQDYFLDKALPAPHLSNVGGETFPISLFPNSLNCIGDKFQDYFDGVRPDDTFNPYQSRPIFNAYAFLNLVCLAYDYTPVFDSSVDWDIVRKTYMVAEGLEKSEQENGGIVVIPHPFVQMTSPHYINLGFGDVYDYQVAMVFTEDTGIAPNSIPNFPSNPLGIDLPGDSFFSKRSIFVPDLNENVGEIRLKAFVPSELFQHPVYGVWTNATEGDPPLIREIATTVDNSTFLFMDVTINKTEFDTPPAGGDQIIGVYVTSDTTSLLVDSGGMMSMQAIETYTPPGVVSYDKDTLEFLQENIDLTYAAPKDNITKILSGLMHKEGILMNIDSENKEVEFFSYSAYKTKVDSGDFLDWTNYLQEYVNPNYNTKYGNEYAITNKLGLNSPYLGNTVKIILGNQTTSSRYKDFAENYLKHFKDVKKVTSIVNNLVPYVEYEVSGTSLVEYDSDLASLVQRNFQKVTQGNLVGLPYIQNVNFTVVPDGVTWWYKLVDSSVRAKPSFLIPINEAKNLDLRKPIYVGQLGGFYILEELEGYQDSSTVVKAKLIKIPDELGSDFSGSQTPSITTIGSSWAPGNPIIITDVYLMLTSTNFNNYIPTSANMVAEKLTGSGGTPTGTVITVPITLNQQGNYLQDIMTIEASDPITLAEEGYYNVYIEDQSLLRSNEVELKLGNV